MRFGRVFLLICFGVTKSSQNCPKQRFCRNLSNFTLHFKYYVCNIILRFVVFCHSPDDLHGFIGLFSLNFNKKNTICETNIKPQIRLFCHTANISKCRRILFNRQLVHDDSHIRHPPQNTLHTGQSSICSNQTSIYHKNHRFHNLVSNKIFAKTIVCNITRRLI